MYLSRRYQVERAAVFLAVIIIYASKKEATARILERNLPFSADLGNDESKSFVNVKWKEIIANRRRTRLHRSSRYKYDFPENFIRAANGSEFEQAKPNKNDLSEQNRDNNQSLLVTTAEENTPVPGQPGDKTNAATRNREVPPPKPLAFGQYNFKYDLKPSPVCINKIKPTPTGLSSNETSNVTEVPEPTTVPPPEEPYIKLTQKQKENILKEHNIYRSKVREPTAADMRILTWDDELAWLSETYTNSCYYRDLVEPRLYNANGSEVLREVDLKRHSYFLSEVGHNWFAWVGANALPAGFEKESVEKWTSEIDLFNMVTSECNGVCHHYLQVIWAETFKLGCGAAWCEEPEINGVIWPPAILFVCSYTPRGGVANYMAANSPFSFFQPKLSIPPYTAGDPCSVCVSNKSVVESKPGDEATITEVCWNDLCKNENRDRKIPFVPPPFTTTYPWIRMPTKSTTTTPIIESTIASNETEIEIQIEDDVTIIIWSGERRSTRAGLPCILLSVILSFFIVSSFSDGNTKS